ncbi:cation transporter [Parvularcula flava]|uniref:Cation transporter n=1 Tax=Aquisalinus luteolus TaxID=1566827 RepID=A0A8J3EPW8_9PROT|nr:cation transporter [Aquisalinus luteolus]NHK26287.1 cation transporter [Aquisalinus luteolus]GGH91872.1 hypothetical protein GCM10011355_00040 [Aquisalinus luteolus]
MADCCNDRRFDGVSAGYKRALVAVIFVNATMFLIEMMAGFSANSQALKADALDFIGDAATYTISLWVIGAALVVRARAALFKGILLAVMTLAVLTMSVLRLFGGEVPDASTIGLIGILALTANLLSVLILMKWRDGDANVRSVWLCSRNDAIGNIGVVTAGLLVGVTGSFWPDVIMSIALAGLFLRSAVSIIRQARSEMDQTKTAGGTSPA